MLKCPLLKNHNLSHQLFHKKLLNNSFDDIHLCHIPSLSQLPMEVVIFKLTPHQGKSHTIPVIGWVLMCMNTLHPNIVLQNLDLSSHLNKYSHYMLHLSYWTIFQRSHASCHCKTLWLVQHDHLNQSVFSAQDFFYRELFSFGEILGRPWTVKLNPG